jgi:hypothetical protein
MSMSVQLERIISRENFQFHIAKVEGINTILYCTVVIAYLDILISIRKPAS